MVAVCTVGGRSCEHLGGYKTTNRIPLCAGHEDPSSMLVFLVSSLFHIEASIHEAPKLFEYVLVASF